MATKAIDFSWMYLYISIPNPENVVNPPKMPVIQKYLYDSVSNFENKNPSVWHYDDMLTCFPYEKYFKDYRQDILKLFEIEIGRKIKLECFYPNAKNSYFIHYRMTDLHNVNLEYYYQNLHDYIFFQ